MKPCSLRVGRSLLGAAAVGGFAAGAAAQSSCVTSQSVCQSGSRQRAGSPCRCADSPAMMGEVVINGDVSPNDSSYRDDERRRSGGLRNDDLDDGDDVLAGPRHHPRRRAEPPARDADD